MSPHHPDRHRREPAPTRSSPAPRRRRSPRRHRPVRLLAGVLAAAAVAASTVLAAPAPATAAEPYGGYLFAYFSGESTADGEQVRFAVSRGNDALRYDQLNGGAPVVLSTVGTGGVRDPFVMRRQDGTFVMIATDLKIHGNGNWDASQRTGSRSLVVWESADLVTWSPPRLQEVAGPQAGNVWAPEAYWDRTRGAYVVFWASKMYPPDDPGHTGAVHNTMWYATTTDFRSFGAPQLWYDPGYSVIDSTVIAQNGTVHRFTKDERDRTPSTPCGKSVTQERAPALTGSYQRVADCIGSGLGAVEGPTVFRSNTENRWYLFLDEYGGRGYVPFTTTDPAGGQWTEATGVELPAGPRHGTVLPVTTAELERLRAAF